MSEINVTPFVDVMLVLLIIFMVTAPLLQHGLELQLPKVDAKGIQKEERWVITIFKNGEINFNENSITLDRLESRLEKLARVNPAIEVLLKADSSLTYGYVVQALAAAKRAGVTNIGMITEPLTVTKK
ncbi:MAG: ExbD/TolR family protein [Nitrospinota bacterium]